MISAVDTSVLLDVLCDDPDHAKDSAALVRRAMEEGQLVVCETVIAELRPALGEEDLLCFLRDWRIEFVPNSLESALLAGRHFFEYVKRGGPAKRVLPDFLVGAHALTHAERLLARDRGYLRDYFKKLKVESGP